MPAYFLDTSALVKRWVEERGSPRVRELTARDAGHHVYIARLGVTEVVGAVVRRHRAARLPEAARAALLALMYREVGERMRVIEIADATWTHATQIAGQYAVRGADAVHVAAATAAQQAHDATDGDAVRFVTADHEQADAARQVGLAVELL